MREAKKWILWVLLLSLFVGGISSESLLALSPPSHKELCKVIGIVIRTGTAEATDDQMNTIIVPTVTVRLYEIKPSGIKEKSYIDCKKLKKGQELIFRNCDGSSYKPGENIAGLVGRSRGGGLHCIDALSGKEG